MKNCLWCKNLKSLSEFHRDRSRKDGRRPYCKHCMKILISKRADRRKALLGNCAPHKICPCKQKRLEDLESEVLRLSRVVKNHVAFDSKCA